MVSVFKISYVANLADQPIKGLETRRGKAKRRFLDLMASDSEERSGNAVSPMSRECTRLGRGGHMIVILGLPPTDGHMISSRDCKGRKRGCITVRSLGDPVTE